MLADMTVDGARMNQAAEAGHMTATDLADWLVRVISMPFRDAHHATGRLVREAETRGCQLAALPIEVMQAIEPRITMSVYDVLSIEKAVASRQSYGGTAPARVLEQVAAARARFL